MPVLTFTIKKDDCINVLKVLKEFGIRLTQEMKEVSNDPNKLAVSIEGFPSQLQHIKEVLKIND